MKKYVKVMERTKSNANGFQYKIDEINVAEIWNPMADNPKEMGGFNFSTEDKILRFIFRGDTIYDVIIPEDAEVIKCEHPNVPDGVFRTNKIIITNPRTITEELVMELYKKSNLPEKTYYQCLVCLLFKNYINIAKHIIKDKINKDNVRDAIKEFESYICTTRVSFNSKFVYDSLGDEFKEIYDILKDIEKS